MGLKFDFNMVHIKLNFKFTVIPLYVVQHGEQEGGTERKKGRGVTKKEGGAQQTEAERK